MIDRSLGRDRVGLAFWELPPTNGLDVRCNGFMRGLADVRPITNADLRVRYDLSSII